jgi:hypothetical protein
MTPASDSPPLEGPTHRTLGIVVPEDVRPDAGGCVHWGGGGVSVAPCMLWKLPNHRRPRDMGRGSTGKNTDHVFSLSLESVRNVELATRADPDRVTKHALVEPDGSMLLDDYRAAIARTRIEWKRVWP